MSRQSPPIVTLSEGSEFSIAKWMHPLLLDHDQLRLLTESKIKNVEKWLNELVQLPDVGKNKEKIREWSPEFLLEKDQEIDDLRRKIYYFFLCSSEDEKNGKKISFSSDQITTPGDQCFKMTTSELRELFAIEGISSAWSKELEKDEKTPFQLFYQIFLPKRFPDMLWQQIIIGWLAFLAFIENEKKKQVNEHQNPHPEAISSESLQSDSCAPTSWSMHIYTAPKDEKNPKEKTCFVQVQLKNWQQRSQSIPGKVTANFQVVPALKSLQYLGGEVDHRLYQAIKKPVSDTAVHIVNYPVSGGRNYSPLRIALGVTLLVFGALLTIAAGFAIPKTFGGSIGLIFFVGVPAVAKAMNIISLGLGLTAVGGGAVCVDVGRQGRLSQSFGQWWSSRTGISSRNHVLSGGSSL